MSACPQSMREVVEFLLAEDSDAFFEIQALRDSVHEILESLTELDRIARTLASDVDRVRESPTGKVPIVLAVHERVTAVSTLVAQLLAAFRELDRGISGWGIDGPDSSDDSPLN
ncbi:MAG: hypothetical protein ACOY0T_37720 [Myxococcota bacterium]